MFKLRALLLCHSVLEVSLNTIINGAAASQNIDFVLTLLVYAAYRLKYLSR